jgi:hypothetical protein
VQLQGVSIFCIIFFNTAKIVSAGKRSKPTAATKRLRHNAKFLKQGEAKYCFKILQPLALIPFPFGVLHCLH